MHNTQAPEGISERRFRTIFEQSPVSTQIFAPDGLCVAANHAWEKRWGITLEQISPYNILEDQQLVERGVMPYIRRAFSGEATEIPAIQYESERTRPGVGAARERWARGFIYPVLDERGDVREVVLMHEDITEQKQAREALETSERRFRAVFESAPVGMSLIDGEGRYIAVNPVRQAMLGYSEDELIGRSYNDVTHPDDIELDRRINEEARSLEKDRYQLEKRFLRKDGTAVWTRMTISMVRNARGEPLYSIAVAEDITGQKSAEEERRRLYEREHALRTRAEEMAKEQDEFLSAVAHDLRTPLTAMRGRIQLLQRVVERGDLDQRQLGGGLERIGASAERMIGLVNELLDVANIEIGRPLRLTRQPVDLVVLARQIADEYQDSADRHQVALRPETPQVVGRWDPGRLERVLANLLSNAIKYTPGGGTIDVTVGAADGWAILRVSDPGIGIPADDLAHIFERFRRAENAAGKIPGTGIGLAAVRQIVDQHGGSITVESTEGHGTTFTVRLPLDPPAS